jgi:hypothetical protein
VLAKQQFSGQTVTRNGGQAPRPIYRVFGSPFHWLIHRAPIDLEWCVPSSASDNPVLNRLPWITARGKSVIGTSVSDSLLQVHHPVAVTPVYPVPLAVLAKGFCGRDLVLFLPCLVIQVDIPASVVHYLEFAIYPSCPLDQKTGDGRFNPVHMGEVYLPRAVTARQKEETRQYK